MQAFQNKINYTYSSRYEVNEIVFTRRATAHATLRHSAPFPSKYTDETGTTHLRERFLQLPSLILSRVPYLYFFSGPDTEC